MKYRIAMWAIAGFLVAGFWALFAKATFPSHQRTNAGCVDFCLHNLPDCDSGQASRD